MSLIGFVGGQKWLRSVLQFLLRDFFRTSQRRLISLGFLVAATVVAAGQTAPDTENGFKNYGSYHGSSVDTVNVMNGNWMFHAPFIPDAAQRGALADHLTMYSSSKIWQPNCTFPSTGPVCIWGVGSSPSLGANLFGGVVLQRGLELRLSRTVIGTNDGSGDVSWTINGYTLTTPDEAGHALYPISLDANSDPTAMETIDTSGYHVIMSGPDANGNENIVTVIDRQGRQYVGQFQAYTHCTPPNISPIPAVGGRQPLQLAAPFGDQSCSQVAWLDQVNDANGNQTSFHGPQNPNAGADTLGRSQPLENESLINDGTGCVSSLTINGIVSGSYTAPNGTSAPVKLCYGAVPLATAFNQTAYGVPIHEQPFNAGVTLQVLVTAILADGSKWIFNYDSYGEVSHVGLPTGGSIDLTWTTIAQSPGCAGVTPVSRAVATRTLNDNNGHSYFWKYQWGTPSNGGDTNTLTNVVTDPLGNDTVHVFTGLYGCRLYETSTLNYQGSQGSGQLLERVDTTYSSTVLPTNSGGDLGNVVPINIQTTVYPSGKVKAVKKSYDAGLGSNAPVFGNVMQELDYDWGQGAPGALLKETDYTYEWQVNSAYLTAHLIDLPASVVVKDPSGNRQAETDYTYDEPPYLTSASISTQHVAAPNPVRGNLTTVSKWLNTSTSPVVSHTNWFDTGEAFQAIDPLGNTTTHSYDAKYAGAYPTQTCNALNQCVTGGYDFSTGLLTSFTDANGNSSTYTYDLLSRLINVQLPPDSSGNQPQTSFTYSTPGKFPLTIERSKSITPSLTDLTTNIFDGLGRVYESQHLTPDGNATVVTAFDGLDHPVSVTNPYYSTSDPTYGVIQTAYDALGRAVQTTKQDGSVVSTQYNQTAAVSANGDCTVTTDEVGNQRKTCSDGLARLIEVNEPMGGSPALAASGSASVGGIEQSTQVVVTPATSGTGSVQISGAVQWKAVSSASTGGTTNITVTGAEQQYPVGIIAGTGSVTFSGSEQVIPAVAAVGSMSINGSLQSKQVQTQAAVNATITVYVGGQDGTYTITTTTCASFSAGRCTRYSTTSSRASDAGNMQYSINANGALITSSLVKYDGNSSTPGTSTTSGLAQSLAGALPGNPYVSAAWNGNNSFTLTATNAGAAANAYSVSIAAHTTCTNSSTSTLTITCGAQGWSFSSNTGGNFANGSDAVYKTVYDSGICSVSVNNHGDSNSWSGSGTTAAGIANSIASAINSDSSSPVNASVSNSSLSFTARTAGAAGNTTLSAGCSYDSSNFTGPSFSTSTSGSLLTGGKDPIYDSGSASITVNGHTNQVNFASGATPASIAATLATNINADTGSAVTATVSNATVNLTATTKGTISNYPMTAAVSYDTGHFKQSSFATSASGTTLTGGWPNPQAVDSGTATVTVNGNAYQVNWGPNDTPGSIAKNLATALQADISVTPTLTGATLYLDPKQAGASYSFSTAYAYDTADFKQASFNNANSISDYGTASVAVNGHNDQVSFAGHDTTATIAAALSNQINSDGAALVNASVFGTSISLTARATGAKTNYSLLSALAYDSAHFSAGSFSPSNSGTTLAGGADTVYKTVYDTGRVWVAVEGFEASVPYQQGSNASALAAALASAINAPGSPSPVTASVSGSTITLTAIQPGAAGNYSVTSGASSSQSGLFPTASFSASWANTALSGGVDSGPGNLASPAVTLYSYNALGNLMCVVQKELDASPFTSCGAAPSLWRPRSFVYDSLGRLLTATNPESGTINYAYDANGNLLQKTSPAPNQIGAATQTISYCYDPLNRVTGKAYSAQGCANGQLPVGTAVVTYNYDSGSNGIGHLTSLADQAGSGSYVYDGLGRITSEQRTIAGITQTLGYNYNLDSSLADLTYPNGSVVTYTPDEAGRTISAIDVGNNINYVSNATYDAGTSLTGFFSGNAVTNTFTYNSRLQPVAITAASPLQTVFSIDYDFHAGNGDNGNVFAVINNRDNTRTQAFTYDTLNRLISAQNAGTDCTKATANGKTEYWGNSYAYDAWGNLLEKQVTKCSAESLSLTVDSHNQLHTGSAPDYLYDAAGNMTYDASTGNSFTYDPENRITGAGGFTYTYDADGNRIEKSNGITGTIYWYMLPGVIAEGDLTGALKSEYVFFNGNRVARRDLPSGAVSYYFSDHLKTASVVTDSSGNILSDSDFYPWGGELQFANEDSNHFKYGGHERDGESGLDYLGARYYGNWLARFLTPDWAAKAVAVPYAELGDPQTLNLYSYVRNRPTVLTDANGHNPGCASGAQSCKTTNIGTWSDDHHVFVDIRTTTTVTSIDPTTGNKVEQSSTTETILSYSREDGKQGTLDGAQQRSWRSTFTYGPADRDGFANLISHSSNYDSERFHDVKISPSEALKMMEGRAGQLMAGVIEASRPSVAWGTFKEAVKDADAHPGHFMGIVLGGAAIPVGAGSVVAGSILTAAGIVAAGSDDVQNVIRPGK